MGELEDLKKQLKGLQAKKQKAQAKKQEQRTIKQLKSQIKAEKFAQTRGGKVFNRIADIGDKGFKVTKRFLSEQPQKPLPKGQKKKKTPVRLSVEEVMARLPA